MSSPLKRKAADDNQKPSPAHSSRLPVRNSTPCGDPRCDIPGCLKGPFTTLYYYPPLSDSQIVAEVSISFFLWHLHFHLNDFQSDKPFRTVNPVVWKLYCPDNFVILHQHRHLLHIMLGGRVAAPNWRDPPSFCIYVPFSQSWELLDPLMEMVEVRFPGFVIIKSRDIEEIHCKGLERLKMVLASTIKSISYT